MAIFNGTWLTQAELQLDLDGLRRGIYSDKYFANVVQILQGAARAGYTFSGAHPRPVPFPLDQVNVGDLRVEVQLFSRRAPHVLVGGIDAALVMLRHCTGYYADGQFIETWQHLEVDTAEDGTLTEYGGNPTYVQPVLKIRGRYRDFALLETPMLGVLSRVSRVATSVYDVLEAANGKPILFFPARFDLPDVQAADGYAYWLAVQRYNRDRGQQLAASVSTDAQGAWWHGHGGGTVPHALIACFMADTAEAMAAYARYVPVEVPRIVLADFNNDSVTDTRRTLDLYWQQYRAALQSGDTVEQRRWTLYGVRLDTSANMVDVSLPPDSDGGVSPALVRAVRQGIDTAYEAWGETGAMQDAARAYCQQVKIVATGGFNRDRITHFEREGVPVDLYGVGSSLLKNDRDTNTDYTMDIVQVEIAGQWVDLAKIGRQEGDNPSLQPVDLSQF